MKYRLTHILLLVLLGSFLIIPMYFYHFGFKVLGISEDDLPMERSELPDKGLLIINYDSNPIKEVCISYRGRDIIAKDLQPNQRILFEDPNDFGGLYIMSISIYYEDGYKFNLNFCKIEILYS